MTDVVAELKALRLYGMATVYAELAENHGVVSRDTFTSGRGVRRESGELFDVVDVVARGVGNYPRGGEDDEAFLALLGDANEFGEFALSAYAIVQPYSCVWSAGAIRAAVPELFVETDARVQSQRYCVPQAEGMRRSLLEGARPIQR